MLETDLTLPIVPNLRKRKSADLLSEPGQKRLASMPHPMPPTMYQTAFSSPAQIPPLPQPMPQLPHQQHIQPRPPPPPPPSDAQQQPSAEGYGVFQSNAPSNGYGVFQSNPSGRKRGRPSKAEKEAQARASVGSLTPSGPIPISPKPAIQPPQGAAPTPTPPVSSSVSSSYAAFASAMHLPSSDPREQVLRGPSGSGSGEGRQGLPSMIPYQPYAERMATSTMSAEKSPSIGNLVTADPPADSPQRGGGGETAQQGGGDQSRNSPPPRVGVDCSSTAP